MILNLTQHEPTQAQIDDGVVNALNQEYVNYCLTFNYKPSKEDIVSSAKALAAIAVSHQAESAMIGGALFLMAPLAEELRAVGIKPLFAFSKRVSHEVNGVKTSVFEHAGFVEAV